MPDDMLLHSIECAKRNLSSVEDWQKDGDAAVERMRAEFDAAYGPAWHVVVGKHFGAKVTHDAKNFVFFYLGDRAVMYFKCG
jgi:dynein light chain LC8-type